MILVGGLADWARLLRSTSRLWSELVLASGFLLLAFGLGTVGGPHHAHATTQRSTPAVGHSARLLQLVPCRQKLLPVVRPFGDLLAAVRACQLNRLRRRARYRHVIVQRRVTTSVWRYN